MLAIRHTQQRFSLTAWCWRLKWWLLVIATGLYLCGNGLYIFAKANLAQYLIGRAWQQSLITLQQQPPWPWADTYPVARLNIGERDWYVLAGANGRNLAFAPTHLGTTALPGNPGYSVIVGHRDTQFNSLKTLRTGDIISVQNLQTSQRYRVTALRIADVEQLQYWQSEYQDDTQHASLTLVTCYPFDSIRPNPRYRFIVSAVGI